MSVKVLSACAVLLAAAGCTVGPSYEAPKTEAPAAFEQIGDQEGVELASRATSDPARLERWWSGFNDPVLDRLVADAVAANLDLKIAFARLREARALRGIVAADQLPTLDAVGGYSRSRGSERTFGAEFAPSDEHDLYQLGFDASWEIDLFGRVRRAVEAADADLAASQENVNDALVTLLAEVAREYATLRGTQRRLAIAAQSVDAQQGSLDLVRSRQTAGLGSDLDVAQAAAQLESRRAVVPILQAQALQSEHRLAVLLGKHPSSLRSMLEETPDDGKIPVPPPEVAVGAPAEVLRRRPDIRRAERELAAATARVGVATADLYPRFTLGGFFRLESARAGDLLDMNSRAWGIGPSFRWPIFDAGRVRAAIGVEDARVEASLYAYERSVLAAFEETENALAFFVRQQIRAARLGQAVDANERSVALTTDRYKAGIADFRDVLASQQLLYDAQDQLAQSQQETASQLVALYKALGGGWEMPPEDAPQEERAMTP